MDLWHRVFRGHVLEGIKAVPDRSIACVATSVPFWSLRDYGVPGQIGLEDTPEEWVEALVEVFNQIRPKLEDEATLWVECGDTWLSDGGPGGGPMFGDRLAPRPRGKFDCSGLKQKDLIGLPWMLAFAMRASGYYLRSEVIWDKPNGRPEGAQDRPHRAHTTIFLLSKSERYWYDPEAVRQPTTGTSKPRGRRADRRSDKDAHKKLGSSRVDAYFQGDTSGPSRHLRSTDVPTRQVWTVHTRNPNSDHQATWPLEIPARCIRSGCPPGRAVFDPFGGIGTTIIAAKALGRSGLMCELNPNWAQQAEDALASVLPMPAHEHEFPLEAGAEPGATQSYLFPLVDDTSDS